MEVGQDDGVIVTALVRRDDLDEAAAAGDDGHVGALGAVPGPAHDEDRPEAEADRREAGLDLDAGRHVFGRRGVGAAPDAEREDRPGQEEADEGEADEADRRGADREEDEVRRVRREHEGRQRAETRQEGPERREREVVDNRSEEARSARREAKAWQVGRPRGSIGGARRGTTREGAAFFRTVRPLAPTVGGQERRYQSGRRRFSIFAD